MRWLLIARIPRAGVFILNRLSLYTSHFFPTAMEEERPVLYGNDAALRAASFHYSTIETKRQAPPLFAPCSRMIFNDFAGR
jgi:hypothetical protein